MTDRADLKNFFEPRGVVIVGAPRKPGFGHNVPLSLARQGWGDRLWLVNPAGGELHGFTLHKSLDSVPPKVDLAVTMVPARITPRTIDEIGKRGIRNAIVESAGFAETGEEGTRLQSELLEAAREHGVRIIGPNCVGVINSSNRFSTVEVVEEALTPGGLGIIAQSGAFGNVLLDGLHEEGLFISKAVTLGNKIDVNELDALEYLREDKETRAIMMYLEGANDGLALVQTLREVTREKPVMILKSGRTETGRAATSSHTGSMSGADELYDAAFSQGGAVRAEGLSDLVNMARVFATQPAPAGKRLAVITSSGSLGALAADAAVKAGLELPPLSGATLEKVRRIAPAWMNFKNPLDVGPSGTFARAIEALAADDNVDMLIAVTIIPYSVFREARPLGLTGAAWFGQIEKIRKAFPQKPMALVVMGAREFAAHMRSVAGPAVPVFSGPEEAAHAMASLWKFYSRQG